MERYIDATKLKDALNFEGFCAFITYANTGDNEQDAMYESIVNYLEHMVNKIDEQPTADVAPVRHGRWEEEPVEFCPEPDFKCSVCGAYAIENKHQNQVLANFCPYCGAKMDLEVDNGE